MDNNNLLTVKQVAEITGTTHQNIYKQLSSTLKPYVYMEKNKKMLKYQVITEHFNLALPESYRIKFDLSHNATDSTDIQPNSTAELNNCTTDSTNTTKFNSDIQPNSTNKLNSCATNATEFNSNNNIIQLLTDQLKEKDTYIKEKNSIIADKDNRITELTNKITELTDKLTVLLENSQQLQQNQQLLSARTADEEGNRQKKSLFLRIFGKK